MLSDYRDFVLLKASPARSIPEAHFHLTHGCLGLTTEYLELILSTCRENTEEELGDFLWYLILTAHALGYNIDNLPTEVPTTERKGMTIKTLGEMLENFISLAKKEIIYGNPQQGVIITCFYGLWREFLFHLRACEFPLDLCLVQNKDKLNKRYQDSFSQEEAAERKDKQV
jgi:NTP pyrophosphatase (non-canonical NTP hydrolase)